MNDETFRSRLMLLLQKSRKAVRLYSNVKVQDNSLRYNKDSHNEQHVNQWYNVNYDLSSSLKGLLENSGGKAMTAGAIALRDRFQREFRMTEADLHLQHKELVAAAEKSDFIKAASIANVLVGLKARVQALQAVHHELQETIDRSNISQTAINLYEMQTPPEKLSSTKVSKRTNTVAQIIPLRRVAYSS